VLRVRTSQYRTETVRLVFDLQGPVDYQLQREDSTVQVSYPHSGDSFAVWESDSYESAFDPADASPATALHHNAPLTHAHRIRTPLLLTHGPASPTDGRSADALYRRLYALNRPVEYARYADASPAQQRDRLLRLHEFLARFLPPSRRAPTVSSDE